MKRLLSAALLLSITATSSISLAQEKLIIYTSMKESLIGRLTDAFKKENPNINIDYQSAGAGKLMAKIAAERQSGKIMADVLWTSEVPDFYKMNAEGLLEKYISPEAANIINPFNDFDGSFTPARLGTLGIAYNTRFIKKAPATWQDLTGKDYKGAYGIANPALSGTSFMSVALLQKQFGWEYFEELRKNRAKMGKGAGQVVDDTASGELVASLAVDYIAMDKIKKGATLALAYPEEMLVIPSPVAIIKNTPNLESSQKFVDFLLSKPAQTIIAEEGTLPVRNDLAIKTEGLPTPEEAMKRSIQIDYQDLIKNKEETIKQFTRIIQGR